MNDLRQKLKKKNKDWLIDRLVELSLADDANADRIVLSLAADDDCGDEFIATFKGQLDRAAEQIVEYGTGSWKSPVPTAGFDSVADALAVILPKNLKEANEISEYALMKLDSVFELQDECELEYLVDAFRHLHLEACYKLNPDPRKLGMRLAELSQQTEWGFFDGPPDGYSEVLGQEGLSVFFQNINADGKD